MFLQCLHCLCVYNSAFKAKNVPKFGLMLLNYPSKDPESFIKLNLKKLKRCASLRKPHKTKTVFQCLLLNMLTNLERRSSIISPKISKILSSYLKNQRRYAFFCKPPNHNKTRKLKFTYHYMIKR